MNHLNVITLKRPTVIESVDPSLILVTNALAKEAKSLRFSMNKVALRNCKYIFTGLASIFYGIKIVSFFEQMREFKNAGYTGRTLGV